MVRKRLTKTVSTRLDGATVNIHAPEIGIVGRIKVDIVKGDIVKIRVEREDEAWFGSVKIEVA